MTIYNHLRCPCDTQKNYQTCCGYYHVHLNAPSPLALMRSRYTAYTLGLLDYIEATMFGKALERFHDDAHSLANSRQTFVNLTILSATESDNFGEVEFKAYYIDEQDRLHCLHEKSQFIKNNENWYYIDGELYPAESKHLLKNTQCPCQSGKKYKQCHQHKPT
jgi:SEC-C motif-containing protein